MNEEFCYNLEKIIFQDIGNRGLSNFWTNGCLFNASTKILECDKNLPSFLLTGFCCMHEKCETDGPIGTAILCKTLRDLGFNSTVLTDSYSSIVVISASTLCPVHITDNIQTLPKNLSFVISIERPSKTVKTRDYRTMRARDISNVTSPLDDLFPSVFYPEIQKPYLTISIGDGGNEVGTGNVYNEVCQNVKFGEDIASSTTCDILILAGVSNWGAIALAASLVILSENIEIALKFIEICNNQEEMLFQMLKYGSYDGVSGERIPSIDGMEFKNEHTMINNSIINIIKQKYQL